MPFGESLVAVVIEMKSSEFMGWVAGDFDAHERLAQASHFAFRFASKSIHRAIFSSLNAPIQSD